MDTVIRILVLVVISYIGGLLLTFIGRLLHLRFIAALLPTAVVLLLTFTWVTDIGIENIINTVLADWKTGIFICIPVGASIILICVYLRLLIIDVGIPIKLKRFNGIQEELRNIYTFYNAGAVLFALCSYYVPQNFLGRVAYAMGAGESEIADNFTILSQNTLYICAAIALLFLCSIITSDGTSKIRDYTILYRMLDRKTQITISEKEQIIREVSAKRGTKADEIEKELKEYMEFAGISVLEPYSSTSNQRAQS